VIAAEHTLTLTDRRPRPKSTVCRARARVACVVLGFLAACGEHKTAHVDSTPMLPAETESSFAWASQVGRSVLPQSTPSARDMKIEPATLADNAYAGKELVVVRRLVYRVAYLVPAALREHKPPVLSPAGELHIDVAADRLRARFVGPGWPVDDGSEVRLRADVPGSYLFDGDGGRPLGPGRLAHWFQGDAALHGRVEVDVRKDPNAASEDGPGDLLCAFLAEWSHTPRDDMTARCAGSLPPGFRYGPWIADLTAIVPLTLPRFVLRADAGFPPDPLATAPAHALFEARDLVRLPPSPARNVPEGSPNTPAAVGGDVLSIDNRGSARVAIVVQGVTIGWVKPHSVGSFSGLVPGDYHIAALKPLGAVVMPSTLTHVPAELLLGKPPEPLEPPEAPSAQLSEPLLNSPDAAR
jgi:hypothetical protein